MPHKLKGKNLLNQIVIINKNQHSEEFESITHKVFIITSGNGCKPNSIGDYIEGTYLNDCSEAKFKRKAFNRFADEYELKIALEENSNEKFVKKMFETFKQNIELKRKNKQEKRINKKYYTIGY